jgi:hypothetical protein
MSSHRRTASKRRARNRARRKARHEIKADFDAVIAGHYHVGRSFLMTIGGNHNRNSLATSLDKQPAIRQMSLCCEAIELD